MAAHDEDKAIYDKLKVLLEEALEDDKKLREQFKVGDKLDIVPKKLSGLLQEVDENLRKIAELALKQQKRPDTLAEDETLVYVYLYNGNGKDFPSWFSMMTKDALFSHSLNRPIYGEEKHILKLLEARGMSGNHAALAMIVKKDDVIEQSEATFAKDPLEQPLLRVREGVFLQKNVRYFLHDKKKYVLNDHGKLVPEKKL